MSVATAIDMDSRQTTILYQSGIKHVTDFDAVSRQTKFEDFQPSGADWQRLTYTYDNVGKTLQILDGSREFTQFGYDNKYRLTSASFTLAGIDYAYTYDATDNRTFASEEGPTTFTCRWSDNDLDQCFDRIDLYLRLGRQ